MSRQALRVLIAQPAPARALQIRRMQSGAEGWPVVNWGAGGAMGHGAPAELSEGALVSGVEVHEQAAGAADGASRRVLALATGCNATSRELQLCAAVGAEAELEAWLVGLQWLLGD